MELYSNENNFNIFYEKKRKELKNLQTLNEFVKPNPYFVYFMFKDTIHVDDYGSIKETLFKFPTLNKVSPFPSDPLRALRTRPRSTSSATTSTPRFPSATMSTRTNGLSRSSMTATLPSSTSALLQLRSRLMRSLSQEEDLRPRRTRAFTSLSRMRSPTNVL